MRCTGFLDWKLVFVFLLLLFSLCRVAWRKSESKSHIQNTINKIQYSSIITRSIFFKMLISDIQLVITRWQKEEFQKPCMRNAYTHMLSVVFNNEPKSETNSRLQISISVVLKRLHMWTIPMPPHILCLPPTDKNSRHWPYLWSRFSEESGLHFAKQQICSVNIGWPAATGIKEI